MSRLAHAKAPAQAPPAATAPPRRTPIEIGRTSDPAEHEADRVAAQRLRISEKPSVQAELATSRPSRIPVTQPEDAIERDADRLADLVAPPLEGRDERRRSPFAFAPSAVWDAVGGQSRTLAAHERHSGFLLDPAAVHVHEGPRATESASALEAAAYTVGNHIVLADGYDADPTTGRRILAHELAHVAQQQGGRGSGRADASALTVARQPKTRAQHRPSAHQSGRGGRGDLDRALIAMGGSRYGSTVEQALAIADTAAIPHERVRQAMLHGASGTSEADRAFAAAVFVIAARKGDPLTAEALERGDLKVAEISVTALRAVEPNARAGYVPAGRDTASLRGRTLYIPSTFRLDSVAQQGAVVHELDHAGMDLLSTGNPSEMGQTNYELYGYMAEAAFYLETLRERPSAERTAALVELSKSTGPVLIRLMVASALQASSDEFDDQRAIVEELNTLTRATDPSSALDPNELTAAWRDPPAANLQSAATAIEHQLRREKRTSPVPLGRPNPSNRDHEAVQRMPRAAGNRPTAHPFHRAVSPPPHPAGTPAPKAPLPNVLARDGTKPAGTPAPSGLQEWTLLYVDKFGDPTDENGDLRWRRITSADQEFQEDYVDNNIDYATINVDRLTGDYDKIEIFYRNGARLVLNKNDIPNPKYWRPQQARALHFDSFEKHDADGFIYPTYQGKIIWSGFLTPNIVSIREQADEKAKELNDLFKLAELTETFGFNVFRWYSAASPVGIEHTAPHPTRNSPTTLSFRSPGTRSPTFETGLPREEPTSRPAPRDEPPATSMALPESGEHTHVKGTGTSTHEQPLPRQQQQQQQQQPGVRLREPEQQGRQLGKDDPDRPQRPRQQQLQQQQTQRPSQGPSLLQRAQAAGVADEIEGPIEVLAVGMTRDSATKTVEGGALPTGGGNFGNRMFAASNVETARVFAARRITKVPGSSPAVLGIALPKAMFETLKQRHLIHFEHMTDPPPELAGSPGQWVIEPDGITAINDSGFFFSIE